MPSLIPRLICPRRGDASHRLRAGALVVAATIALNACATTHPENPDLDKFPPGVGGSTDITYYDVHGRTARELVTQLRALGPKTSSGAFWAETRSPMRWTWRTRSEGGGRCSLTSVQVYVHSEMTMPRWVPPADTEPGLYAAWQNSMAALQTHEIGHKDISARAARDILQRLNAVESFCSGLNDEAKRVTDGIIARERTEQEAYDAQTRHGLTQGTAFPPRPRLPPPP
jgi:predicted secreted Zn-dependent protease